MSAKENMRIVRRIYEQVFDRHNLEVVDELYTTGFVYHSPGNPDLDREGLKRGFAEYLAAFPDARMTVEDMLAAGDRVAVRWTACGTHQGEYMGIPATESRSQSRRSSSTAWPVARWWKTGNGLTNWTSCGNSASSRWRNSARPGACTGAAVQGQDWIGGERRGAYQPKDTT